LNGCDFGKPLAPDAPSWLAKLGTFPEWDKATGAGDGSPAFVQHHNAHLLAPDATASLAVHPTQLYESLVGLALLIGLFAVRRHQRFRGQVFLSFAFAYGLARFLLEIWRDDLERGDVGFALAPHLLFPLSYAVFGAAFAIGFAQLIPKGLARTAAQILAFVPAIWAFWTMRPGAFVLAEAPVRLSTSQFIGLLSAAGAGLGFAVLYRAAQRHPEAAMALPEWDDPAEREDGDEDEEEDGGNAKSRASGSKAGPAEAKKKPSRAAETSEETDASADTEAEPDDAPKSAAPKAKAKAESNLATKPKAKPKAKAKPKPDETAPKTSTEKKLAPKKKDTEAASTETPSGETDGERGEEA
jgi:phosphatidylglycerol:prolipoprotein diacylglycerol transferase